MVPFHTHGGGGVGLFEEDIAKMCPDSTVTEGFGEYNSGGSETAGQISAWLSDIETISPRPILFIMGENAHSIYFTENAYKMAAEPK